MDTLIQGDYNNVAPRVGFAWNVGNEGKTVIRGNTGLFYDTLESSLKAFSQVNHIFGLDPANPPATFGQVTQRQSQIEGQVSIRYRF